MKERVDDLAVFGGQPLFAEKLHVGRPNVGDRTELLERINDILDRRWFTNNGPYVQQFEKRVAEMSGARHCIACCNATIGLELVIRALGLRGEVIVPSFTFIATAHALQWQEITPVFADIDAHTHLIDPRSVKRLITPRTTGIIGVHLWGQCCPVEALQGIADEHGLKLIFDAAHAFGCARGGQRVGSFGQAEVFSFHATKFVNSLEGGAIVTNDDALAEKVRLMQNFGFLGFDNVGYLGTNGKMNEFSAAMGLTSIDSMDAFVELNRNHSEEYRRELAGIPGLSLLNYVEANELNYQYIVTEVDGADFSIGRDRLLDVLWAENLLARRYFYPGCHRMQPYRSYFPNAGLLLPVTERVCERILLFPTGQGVSREQIRVVSSLLRFVVEHGPEINARLGSVAQNIRQDVAYGTSAR